jgi:hypothetical protein
MESAPARAGLVCGRCARPRVRSPPPRPTSSGGPRHRPAHHGKGSARASGLVGECSGTKLLAAAEAGRPEVRSPLLQSEQRRCCYKLQRGLHLRPGSNGSPPPLPPAPAPPPPEPWRPARPHPPSRSPPARGYVADSTTASIPECNWLNRSASGSLQVSLPLALALRQRPEARAPRAPLRPPAARSWLGGPFSPEFAAASPRAGSRGTGRGPPPFRPRACTHPPLDSFDNSIQFCEREHKSLEFFA